MAYKGACPASFAIDALDSSHTLVKMLGNENFLELVHHFIGHMTVVLDIGRKPTTP